jgi:hypothetical protein
MPFRHPDRSHDLRTRLDYEVRERLEEAIDFVCLDALVSARKARGLPAPAADSEADRTEYAAHVLAFLRLLDAHLPAGVADAPRRAAEAPSGSDEQARLLAGQLALAKSLPDYWQRFELMRARYLTEPPPPSGGERRSVLARLFGRG